MDRRDFLRISLVSFVGLLGAGLGGCTSYPHGPSHRERRPPRRDYEYYYYPEANVYFHIVTGYYYFPYHGRWYRSQTLPSHFHLTRRYRKRIFIEEARPYQRNHEHREKYGRGYDRQRHGRRDQSRSRRKEPDRSNLGEGRHDNRSNRAHQAHPDRRPEKTQKTDPRARRGERGQDRSHRPSRGQQEEFRPGRRDRFGERNPRGQQKRLHERESDRHGSGPERDEVHGRNPRLNVPSQRG